MDLDLESPSPSEDSTLAMALPAWNNSYSEFPLSERLKSGLHLSDLQNEVKRTWNIFLGHARWRLAFGETYRSQ